MNPKRPEREGGATREGPESEGGATTEGPKNVSPAIASRVVLSYPETLNDHAVGRLHEDYYQDYLRKVHERAYVGDEWAEFTDIGCCGSQAELALRVERVDGGGRLTPETTIEYQPRAVDGESCAWALQNDMPE